MNKHKSSLWRHAVSFPRAFHYEVKAPMPYVLEGLAALEKTRGFFDSTSQEITLIPSGEEYRFRFVVRRKSSTTALAEGYVWEEFGKTHVEGQMRINGWLIILPIGLSIPWVVLFTTMSHWTSGIMPFMLVALILLMTISNYWGDRQYVLDELECGVRKAALRETRQAAKRTLQASSQADYRSAFGTDQLKSKAL